MRDYFFNLAERLCGQIHADEVLLCSFSGEESDFVRMNKSAVRQAGNVEQRSLRLELIRGRRHAQARYSLAGSLAEDEPMFRQALADLRIRRDASPEDPHFLYATEPHSSEEIGTNRIPRAADALDAVAEAGSGRDLVGIYASGATHAGFANSLGQRNWITHHSYNFDWSFFAQADKAVKESYAGFEWDPGTFEAKLAAAGERLRVLERPIRNLDPGRYRVYLSPGALWEIVELLGWGGFSLRAHRTKATPLLRMVEQGAHLHPSLDLREDTAHGVAPPFESSGFHRPDQVPLIEGGRYRECLVSPRSAVEFDVATNGASGSEAPNSLGMSAGSLATENVSRELGRGIYVSNLWYLNYSDRNACRTTGMTRFATFWVEDGHLQAPIPAMRFDETLYRMLGENLLGLTRERERIFDPGTYCERSTRSAHLPGALIDDFTLTL